MKDYSQFGEQEAILRWAGNRKSTAPGRFLDIGAWDPYTFSNTRALYELGWRGVLIEPSPRPMMSLLAAYKNDPDMVLVQAAVTTDGGDWIELYVSDDAVSTTSLTQYTKWQGSAEFRGRMMVRALDVQSIANRFGGFEVVSIDVEGHSVDLFLAMLNAGHYPPCVCVEHDDRMTELMSAATAKRYQIVLANGTNVVMVR